MSEGCRYAILIGSSRFENEPKLIPLKCPERDVDGMREILAAAELGAFGETFVFKDAENHAVLRRIEEVLADATREDQVLIYYSGHGETDLPGRLYLATTNTEVRRLVSTSIPVETLRLFIENSSCRKIMLILDCCYGGAVGKSFSRGSVDEKLKELARGSGVYILTASTAAQTAQEREGDDYGLLTKHIISGIKQGEADINDDGFVSMDDLYSYVFAKVKSEGYLEPMRWALNVKGEDLIIARASGTPGREKQRLLNEKVIEFRDFLPRQIFLKALQLIDEPRTPFYDLIDKLYRQRLQIGEFIEEWQRLESVERQQPPQPLSSQLRQQPEEPVKIEVVERQPQPEMSPLKPQTQETMAKTLCKIGGGVLAVVGIAGFLKHDLFGMHLTTIHNIVHLVTAAIALYFGFYGSDATARTFCQVFGAIYLLLGIVGFIAPDVVANVIQSHTAMRGENLTPDNIVHLLVGAVFMFVGLHRAPQPAAT